jgi:hypothetical protein
LAMPRDAKPVTQWSHRDAAWDSVVADIRDLITNGSTADTVKQPRQKYAASPSVSTVVYGKRDVWLADAIWRVFLGTWDLPPHDERAPIGQNENQRFFDLVTKEFRQAAFDGQLPIWAKRSNSDLWEEVPEVYWKDRRISYLNVIREDPTKLSVEEAGSLKRSSEWREFMTSRAAVNTIWPAENK